MKTRLKSLFFLKIGIMLLAVLLLFPPVISKADDEFDIEQIGEPINVTTNYTKSGKKVEKSTNAIIGDLIDVTISKSAPKTSTSCGNGHARTTVSLSGGSATAYVELLDADGVVLDKFTLTTLQIPLSDYPDLAAIHLYSYVKDSSGKCSTCGATLSGSSGSASAKVTFYKRIIKGPLISSNLTTVNHC